MKIALTRTMMLVAVVAMMALVSAGCGGESAKSSSSTKTGADQPADVQKSQTPLVPKPQMIDWCKEHGVPESVCTRCNSTLIADFKAKNDWCKEHNLPESQCIECHPDLAAKWKAQEPKAGPAS